MLVAVGRAPLVQGLGLDEIGVPTDPRAGIATDDHMRTAIPTIFAAGDVAGRWQLAHTAFREGEIAAENAMGHESALGSPSVPRPIYTDPEIAGVGLTEAQARERYGDDVAVGMFPWVANARAVMSGATTGWVKSIHETTYGELLGLVIVGPARHRPDRGGRRRDRLPSRRSRPSQTGSHRIRHCRRRSRKQGSSPSAGPSTYRRSAADVRLREIPQARHRDVDRLVVPETADPQARHGGCRRIRRRRGAVVRAPAPQAASLPLAAPPRPRRRRRPLVVAAAAGRGRRLGRLGARRAGGTCGAGPGRARPGAGARPASGAGPAAT